MSDGGNQLLAGLYRQMERISKLQRIRKALQRKAQNRSMLDISHIREETQDVTLFTFNGDAVHRDLCHVAKLKRIGEGETVIVKGMHFYYVMSGTVNVTTEDPALLKNKLDDHRKANQTRDKASSGNTSGGVSEEELRELFNSIDTDGSGAIDGEELQTALEMMGIQLSEENIAELMEGVDDDGSGELEFPEFVEIMTQKLKLGKPPDRKWAEKTDASGATVWERDFLESHFFGETSVLDEVEYKATLLAVEEADLVVIEAPDYHTVLTEGFDGELKKKVNFLTATPVIQSCIISSDLRSLAFASQKVRFSHKAWLYQEGEEANAIYFIESGTCRVQSTMTEDVPDMRHDKRAMSTVLREDVMLEKRRRTRTYPLATLGDGDMCGEEAIITPGGAHVHSVLAVTAVNAFKIDIKVIQRLVHNKDLSRLREHCSAILNWRRSQLEAVIRAVQAAKERATGMLNRARRMQKQINEARTGAGLPKATISEISGLAGLADSVISDGRSESLDLNTLLRRIPPPTLDQQAARQAEALDPSRAARRAASRKALQARKEADAKRNALQWEGDSDADSEVSLSEYATRRFATDMVTRNAMNRADMLARTTQDRIAAAIGAGEPPGPSHGSHRERHEKEAADATAWDGRDVASSGESSDETLDSDDLPMLKKHRHVGGSPEREQFRRHRRQRPAERREMATAVILEEGPLAVAVGLSGPAFLDPAAAGLTLSEIKEVLQSVRTKVRQAQAWKADAAHSLSATRGTLAAARRVGMSAVPSPSRTAGADEQGWEHSAREADSAAGDRLAGDASARSRMMDDTGPAVAAVPSTSGRGGRDSVGLSQSVDGSVREGILPESAVSKAAMSLRTEAVMRSSAKEGLLSQPMRSSRPGSSSRASDRSSEHQAADGSPGKSKPADALQPTKSIGRRPKRGSKASQAKAEALRQDVKPSDITAEMAAERMEEVAGTRMGPTEMVGGGSVPRMRLESAEALHKAGVSAGLGSRSARFVSKTHGGRLQSVATTKARWWERDSTANQATRTMNYLKRQEDRIRRLDPHAALDADGTPVQGGTARGRGHGGDLTMAGVLDGLPRIVSATGRVNMQALAKAAHTVGGSQHTALRAAHAVLRSPLTLTEEMVGKFTPEQLGITGFTRALTLAGIDVAGAGGAMGADWRRQALRDGAPVGAMQGAGTSGAGAPGVGPAGAGPTGHEHSEVGDKRSIQGQGVRASVLDEATGLLKGDGKFKKTFSGRILLPLPQNALDDEADPVYVEVCAPKTLNQNTVTRQVGAFVPKGRLIKARKVGETWH